MDWKIDVAVLASHLCDDQSRMCARAGRGLQSTDLAATTAGVTRRPERLLPKLRRVAVLH